MALSKQMLKPKSLIQKKNTSSSSSEDTEESEQGKIVIFNALLTYATYAMENSSYDTTKAAILGHFCAQDINNAQDSLWDKCGVSVIGGKPKRRDSSIRSEKEADVFDILTALNTLDNWTITYPHLLSHPVNCLKFQGSVLKKQYHHQSWTG